ncbi:tigger transposable element-derived protein 6-like [Gigantopelta aegis]|uniref:tigger transposable element-derived protein 6-like n=1 Tax=Gigantopelta aegis TaxID=1735272 RepID=UPI001B8887C8|nr:tigger transposable element-derived protein 6-like [Gigantopelta aegis]
MAERPKKRQRIELSLETKVKLIQEFDSNPQSKQKDLALKFKIGKQTVSDIIKRKQHYLQLYDANISGERKRITNGKFENLNGLLHQWFNQARSKTLPISGPILKEKALQFAEQLGIADFKASDGWLTSWKTRFNIKQFKVSGESAGVNHDVVDDYKERLLTIIGDFDSKDIFNCDETGLFFRALPDKTLSYKSQAAKGGKISKERLTVLLCCSSMGEKLKPLVIGKAQNPRCFKNINKDTLPVTWTANRKAWMTSQLFNDWLQQLNRQMRQQRRKILLFIDNAPSHGQDLSVSNVTVKFLPANTTSVLQPLDQGIIKAFKARYRKYLMRSLISRMEDCASVTELCKAITVLDAVNWINAAWKETQQTTIAKCFMMCGFPVTSEQESDDENDDNIPLATLLATISSEVPVAELLISITIFPQRTRMRVTGKLN